MDDIIQVRIVRTFRSVRTPCPPAGTVGELYDFDEAFALVRFALPLVDQDGATWLSHGDDTQYMHLKFLPEEIELAD